MENSGKPHDAASTAFPVYHDDGRKKAARGVDRQFVKNRQEADSDINGLVNKAKQ